MSEECQESMRASRHDRTKIVITNCGYQATNIAHASQSIYDFESCLTAALERSGSGGTPFVLEGDAGGDGQFDLGAG